MDLVENGDGVFLVGHRVNSYTTVSDLRNVDDATTLLDFSNHGFHSKINETNDEYHHTSRTLLDYTVYCTPKLSLVLDKHYD